LYSECYLFAAIAPENVSDTMRSQSLEAFEVKESVDKSFTSRVAQSDSAKVFQARICDGQASWLVCFSTVSFHELAPRFLFNIAAELV
jgi:hypothetical protein